MLSKRLVGSAPSGALGVFLFLLASIACFGAEADLFPDPVVARGKGFEIRRSKVQDSFVIYKANMAATRGRRVPETERSIIESNLLQRLIITEILTRKATPEEKQKANAETQSYIAKAKEQYQDRFDAQVKASGMSFQQFVERATEQTLCELVLEREIKSKIAVSDAAIQKFYQEHPSEFEEPEQVRISHILISIRDASAEQPISPEKRVEKQKFIGELKARAEKGEDFSQLAKQYSEDPRSKDKGGEYTFSRGQMLREFETAAFSLKLNQISDVVQTPYGYHIIKLLEKIPAKPQELSKVTPAIKRHLINIEFEKQIPEYLKELQKQAGVEVLDAHANSGAASSR